MIPASHVELLKNANPAILATIKNDNQPHSSVMWVEYDGEHILFSTVSSRQKAENIDANPNVSVLIVDPDNMYRYLEVRGKVVSTDTDEGCALINALAKKYRGVETYYGNIVKDADSPEQYERIILKVKPENVVARG